MAVFGVYSEYSQLYSRCLFGCVATQRTVVMQTVPKGTFEVSSGKGGYGNVELPC